MKHFCFSVWRLINRDAVIYIFICNTIWKFHIHSRKPLRLSTSHQSSSQKKSDQTTRLKTQKLQYCIINRDPHEKWTPPHSYLYKLITKFISRNSKKRSSTREIPLTTGHTALWDRAKQQLFSPLNFAVVLSHAVGLQVHSAHWHCWHLNDRRWNWLACSSLEPKRACR